MLDLIPWLDETYIIEMGRLFFCGGIGDSTLMGRADVVLLPVYYIGPCLQELAFRLFGEIGVRLSPYVGLIAAAAACRLYLRRIPGLSRLEKYLLAVSLLFSPILFQSVLLTRIDSWALACVFAAFAALGSPNEERPFWRLALGAAFAVLSAFIWPTAAVLTIVYPAFFFTWKRRREFIVFCGFGLLAAILLLLPVAANFNQFWSAFARHHAEVTSPASSVADVVIPLAREAARSPLVAIGALAGLFAWIRTRRFMAIAAFLLVFAVFVRSSLYTFRIIYLVPIFFLMIVDAVKTARNLRVRFGFLVAMAAYGVLTGPIGHFTLDYPTLPDGLKECLAREIGTGPKRVFSPDHATYYIGRELGWSQRGFARPSELDDAAVLLKALDGCDAAVLREFDPYTPFQQSCTPYGLFCKYVLSRAKAERNVPDSGKSWAARFGGQFSFAWHKPLLLLGFREIARHGMIRVLVRE